MGNAARSRILHLGLIGIILISLFAGPLTSFIKPVSAPPVTVLTPKWTRTGLGTNWEGGQVIGDVTGDGQEDVVYAGGGSDMLVVLNGDDGTTIATYSNPRIYMYCQPQLYDIDNDNILEILVPLYYEAGLAAVQYDGYSTLQEMWVATPCVFPGNRRLQAASWLSLWPGISMEMDG